MRQVDQLRTRVASLPERVAEELFGDLSDFPDPDCTTLDQDERELMQLMYDLIDGLVTLAIALHEEGLLVEEGAATSPTRTWTEEGAKCRHQSRAHSNH